MKLVIFGAPGAGKGTLAVMLAQRLKLKKISLGDMLREEAKKNTPLGNTLAEYMQKGALVDDKIVAQVIKENITEEDFILDGYPRNINQALTLDEILKEKGLNLDYFIYLNASEQTIIERLSGRRVCAKCGAIYHIKNMPPKKEGVCDICGGQLITRKDDTVEVIKKRWNVFQAEATPIIEHYRKQGKLIEVDSNKDKDVVFSSLWEKING